MKSKMHLLGFLIFALGLIPGDANASLWKGCTGYGFQVWHTLSREESRDAWQNYRKGPFDFKHVERWCKANKGSNSQSKGNQCGIWVPVNQLRQQPLL